MAYRVFISSTLEDLAPYRKAARDAVIRMGMLPVMVEDFGAIEGDPAAFIRQQISESDIFVGIYAHSYGRALASGPQAMIEREYGWARESGLQRILFKVNPEKPWPPKFIARGEDELKLQAFLEQVAANELFQTFGSMYELQAKLFFALHKTEGMVNHQEGILQIAPIFGAVSSDPQFKLDAFMIMPFREQFQPIYREVIRPALEQMNLSIKRGDEFFSQNAIISEIWSAIYNSKFVIAEYTGRNDNVAYELGIAHTLGKPGIIITQTLNDIPFDLQSLRIIGYEDTPEGRVKLGEQLNHAVSWLWQEHHMDKDTPE